MKHWPVIAKFFRFWYVVFVTFRRDLRVIPLFLSIRFNALKMRLFNTTVHKCFEKQWKKHPNKPALVCDESSWTFEQVEQYSNQIANYFHGEGLRAGDEVAVLMPSKPEQVLIWFGLSKIGVVPALLNENLRSDPLIHSITCIKSKAVIFDAQYEQAIVDVYPSLSKKRQLSYHCYGPVKNGEINAVDFKEKLKQQNNRQLNVKHEVNYKDVLFYVYTSGTTGLPKAVITRNYRVLFGVTSGHKLLRMNNDDIIYCPVPLYHNLGTIMCVSHLFIFGRTVVIKRKFSASIFWEDCVKYNCTVAPYIGELARYLLQQPPKPTDKLHKVRKMIGVGLRRTIWKRFKDRFGVTNIVELFASSEGNANLANIDNTEGACGFLPVWLPNFLRRTLYPITFIKVDMSTGDILRDDNGYCIDCDFGETGMIITKINNDDPTTAFDGYVNKMETEKKILRDVFTKGDAYFMSGDVLFMDEFGYVYFKDRIGDTFRWKGENVSTNEIEGQISKILNIPECIVYGVEIPNAEGKAGMVAIATSQSIDLESLHKEMRQIIPSYAIPLFVRIMRKAVMTDTFKFSKVSLKQEAYNVTAIADPVFYFDSTTQKYVKLEKSVYEDIMNGQICF